MNQTANPTPKNKKSKRNIIIIVAGIVFAVAILCIFCGIFSSKFYPKSTPTVVAQIPVELNTEVVTLTIPTDIPVSIDTPLPTPTFTKTPGIPDLSPYDVISNLEEKRGFTCTDVDEVQAEGLGTWFVWTCDRENMVSMHVEIMSYSLLTVDNIDATITQVEPSDEIAVSFLGFMATSAFIDNKDAQNSIKTWVEQTLPTVQKECIENIYNGINFRLCGVPTGRWIEIGNME